MTGLIWLLRANGTAQDVYEMVLGIAGSAIGVRYLLEPRAQRRLLARLDQERAGLQPQSKPWWL